MTTSRILRLKRTDSTSSPYILLNIAQNGSRPLDLKLVATEHEHLYHGNIQQASVKALQASNYAGDLEEWKAILEHALHSNSQPEIASSDALQGLELVASVIDETLTVTVRKNIGGITQRLGVINLHQDDALEEVSFPEWTDTAVARSDELAVQLQTLQKSVRSQQGQVAKLNLQLDDLIKAKKEHESEMLQKFAQLLNAKKLKIRDQQRLLAGAKIDSSVAAQVSGARSGGGASRSRKQKANGRADLKDEDEEMNDEVCGNGQDDDDDDVLDGKETPPPSEHEDDDDGDGFETALPVSQRNKATHGPARSTASALKSNVATHSATDDTDGRPPKRQVRSAERTDLALAPPKPAAAKPTLPVDDDETDDEL